MPNRARARELAAEFNRKGDATGWFDPLYREAEEGKTEVPWADLCPNPRLLEFLKSHAEKTSRKSALVIGTGLGDDAEQLAAWGFRTVAFDVSATAIHAAQKRFPHSIVEYHVVDLLAPPATWRQRFDFVLEVYTLQVLPAHIRPRAIERIAEFVRPGGLLFLIARGREPSDPEGEMPWPLTREEIRSFTSCGLAEKQFEEYFESSEPSVRRFCALYSRR